MPLADALKFHMEFVVKGIAASQGSTGKDVVNVFHFRRTSNVNVWSKLAAEVAFQGTIGTALEAALNVSYSHVSTDNRCLEDNTDAYLTTAVGNPGAIAGDRFPPNVSAFLFFRTGLRGREFMGRKFLGPMSESDSTAPNADLWNAGAMTRLNALGTAILAGFTDANGNVWKPVVLSRLNSDFTVQPAFLATQDVTAVLVNKRIGRFKRRTVKSVY